MSADDNKNLIPPEELDCDKLAAQLYRCSPLSTMNEAQIPVLISLSVVERYPSATQLYSDGIPKDVVLYLLKGGLEISQDGSNITVEADTDAALKPFSNKHFSTAAITTSGQVDLIRIEKELIETLTAWGQISAPETEVVMSAEGIVTIDRASWLNSMIKSPTFRKLPATNIEELLNKLEPIRVNAGDLIIRQGDQGDYFYMINNGVAMVTINPENDEDSVIMAELNEGASFGEAALISDKPRNATITMMDDGVLLRLSKEDFINLLKQPTLRWVDFEKAQSIVKRGAKWIDVRMAEEYARGHIPGAINIPMRDLHKRARELNNKIPYICYCESSTRSSAAAFALSQYEIRTAVLKDGIDALSDDILETSDAAA